MGSILLEPDQLCGKRYPPGPSHPGPAVGGLFNDPMSPDIRLRLDQNVFYSYEVLAPHFFIGLGWYISLNCLTASDSCHFYGTHICRQLNLFQWT